MPGLFPTAEEQARTEANLLRNEERFYQYHAGLTARDEAERNRQHELQQQSVDIGGKRDLAADQFGYQYALADQGFGQDVARDQIKYAHDNDLYVMHQNGAMAEQHLANIQQREMALLNSMNQRDRDILLQGFNVENAGIAQQYDLEKTNLMADRTLQRDEILHGYSQQDMEAGYSFDAAKTRYMEIQREKAAATKIIADAWSAREEANRRLEDAKGMYDYQMAGKYEEMQRYDKQKKREAIGEGLRTGTWVMDPAAQKLITDLREKKGAIWSGVLSGSVDRRDGEVLMKQLNDDIEETYFQGARELDQAEIGMSQETARQQFIQSRGLSSEEAKFVIPDKGGTGFIYDRAASNYDATLKKIEATADYQRQTLDQKDRQLESKQEEARKLQKERLEASRDRLNIAINNAASLRSQTAETLTLDQWMDNRDRFIKDTRKELRTQAEGVTKEVPGAMWGTNIVPLTEVEQDKWVEDKLAELVTKNFGKSYSEFNASRAAAPKKRFRFDPKTNSLSPVE